ncbi:MAG: DUF4395 domain-containing protein [Acidimicrobiales bacterium]
MAKLIDFPNPVNETSARVVAGGVLTMAVATIAFDEPRLLFPLTYGFAARVLTGPKLSPLGQLATRVITPRIKIEHQYVPGPPKRLAQAMGLAMSSTATVLYWGLGKRRPAYGVLGALAAAAALESLAGFCIACRLFPLLMKAGLVPEGVCEDCGNIWNSKPATKAATKPAVALAVKPAVALAVERA